MPQSASQQLNRALLHHLHRTLFGAPSPTLRLRDGSSGYRPLPGREDSCLAAAIATCLQVPLEDVPDPHLDERLEAGDTVEAIDDDARRELDRWLAARGLRMQYHWTVPANRRRWIGVVALPGAFQSHCMVMSFDQILYHPANTFDADDITYGISFNRERTH